MTRQDFLFQIFVASLDHIISNNQHSILSVIFYRVERKMFTFK